MANLLMVALNPLVNLAAAVAAVAAIYQMPFFPAVVSVVVLAVVYVVVGPRVRRAKAMWGLLCPPAAAKATVEGTRDAWRVPTLIIVHHLGQDTHSAVGTMRVNAPGLDQSVMCIPPSRVFHMPLSRLALHLLGGIVPYSRNVAINLLRRKASAPVVVSYAEPIRTQSSGRELRLASKGVFSAALRTGATIVPCLITVDGVPHFGEPIKGTEDQAPAPEAVLALCATYAQNLVAVYEKYEKGQPLVVLK